MRKVFLEDLLGDNRKNINCSLLEGKDVRFIYDELEGYINILNCGYIYKSNRKRFYLTVKYKNNTNYMDIHSLCKGKIGNLLNIHTKNFKIEIGTEIKDKHRDITIIDREIRQSIVKNNKIHDYKYYKYNCDICTYNEGWIEESNLLHHKKGCSVCAGLSILEGYNDVPTTAPWMVEYFQGGYDEAKLYTKGSGKYIYPICPDCGRVKDSPMKISTIYAEHSIGCTCSDKISYPNKFAYSFLDQLNEIYGFEYLEHEYSPEWIGRKSYDNYFIYNCKEYILEMDGGFHFNDNNLSGQTKEESKTIDNYKDTMAKEHGIEVIRIDCNYGNNNKLKYIKQNILNSKLSELFDLTKLDWIKCEGFSLNNLVKVTCAYKKNNPNIDTTEIANIMNLDVTTIIKYLKKGVIQGWCEYIPKTKLEVEIFKDGISLGVFPSGNKLENKSEELFGVKLNRGGISSVCLGKVKHHKGFTFKHTLNQ